MAHQTSALAVTVTFGRRMRQSRLLAALALAVLSLFASRSVTESRAAFSHASAPTVLDRARTRGDADDVAGGIAAAATAAADRRRPGAGRRLRPRRNTTAIALQLGESLPPAARSEVAQGPQWATCFVEARAAARLTSEGVAAAHSVLEEWVVRGERQRVSKFRAWRNRQAQDSDSSANIRCVPKSAKAAEDAFCLECISHSGSGALPFTPLGTVTTYASGAIMTFGGLHECLANTGGAGYCKTGTVAVAE